MGFAVRDLGFDPERFYTGNPTRADRAAIALRSYMEVERWLRDFHGPITIPHRPDLPPGLQVYQAQVPPMYLVSDGLAAGPDANLSTGMSPQGLRLYAAEGAHEAKDIRRAMEAMNT